MIAIIYEGLRTEPQFFSNIAKLFFPEQDFTEIALEAAYGGNLFDFYNTIQLDDDMDIISQIQYHINNNFSEKQKSPFKKFLEKNRDDFQGIYLFFDFDLHHNLHPSQTDSPLSNKNLKEKLNILRKLLTYFNNETEHGKLYINYPMAESLKDLRLKNSCENRCTEKIAKTNSYKKALNSTMQDFQNVSHYKLSTWSHFAKHAAQKANCIINAQYELPAYNEFINSLTQNNLFEQQKTSVLKNNQVFIINSIPLFLLEYFGKNCWLENGLLAHNDGHFSLTCTNDCPNH